MVWPVCRLLEPAPQPSYRVNHRPEKAPLQVDRSTPVQAGARQGQQQMAAGPTIQPVYLAA